MRVAAGPEMTTSDVVALIVERYHDRLRDTLPRLESLAARAARSGTHREQLREVERILADLVDATLPHLDEEEHHVFPVLVGARRAPAGFGRVLAAMMVESRIVDELVERMRRVTDGFHLPDDALPEHRALVQGLAELAEELDAHTTIERDVLLPRYDSAVVR